MIKNVLMIAVTFIAVTIPNAVADIYTPAEQEVILKFPTDNGNLNWDDLTARVEAELPADTSSNDYYVGSIVALRTGERDLAMTLSDGAKSVAISDDDFAKASLLSAFLKFYLSPSSEREIHKEALALAIDEQTSGDWLSGTSASVLVEHAYTASDPVLSKRVLDRLSELLSEQDDVTTKLWFVNSYLKTAYAAALAPDQPSAVEPVDLLEQAVMIIFEAQKSEIEPESLDRFKKLYYRSHVIDGVVNSRRRTKGDKPQSRDLPMIPSFHPEFQTVCLEELDRGRKSVRFRKEFGTGGMLLLVSFNKKGKGKFVDVIDAQPIKMKNEFMHRYYKTAASSMRVKVDETNPDCLNGGQVIVPFSIYWD